MANSRLRPSFWTHDHCIPLSRDLAPASLFERHRDYVCFDLETKDLAPRDPSLENLSKLGVSVCCAWDSKTQQMHTYFEDQLGDFIKLCRDRLIIGYNIRRFDLPVLTGYGLKLEGLNVFDLMDEVERGLTILHAVFQHGAAGLILALVLESAEGMILKNLINDIPD